MRVLVCGGRDFFDRRALYAALDAAHAATPFIKLILGGAQGADQLAYDWAGYRQVKREMYPADWDALGRLAGPIRNQRMIDEGKPDLVIAFPGGRGTADMMRKARAAGIEVVEPLKEPLPHVPPFLPTGGGG